MGPLSIALKSNITLANAFFLNWFNFPSIISQKNIVKFQTAISSLNKIQFWLKLHQTFEMPSLTRNIWFNHFISLFRAARPGILKTKKMGIWIRVKQRNGTRPWVCEMGYKMRVFSFFNIKKQKVYWKI